MEKKFKIDILTPTEKFFSVEGGMIVARTCNGEIGIMSGHLPLVAAIATGPMKIFADGEWLTVLLSEGFMMVNRDRTVVLVDDAKWPQEIGATTKEI
ncbi:MAG: ATP synthase F1 subunit epsilon [Dethiobacteria bacterium]|jgi:F-type H+-transporting ATPase subunit epsilon